jgi:hypothetical protein
VAGRHRQLTFLRWFQSPVCAFDSSSQPPETQWWYISVSMPGATEEQRPGAGSSASSAISWAGRDTRSAARWRVTANALPDADRYQRDNVVVTLSFQEGLSRISLGKTRRTRARRDKGHEQEIHLTLEALCQGRRGSDSDPSEELVEVSAATLAIKEAIGARKVDSPPATRVRAV